MGSKDDPRIPPPARRALRQADLTGRRRRVEAPAVPAAAPPALDPLRIPRREGSGSAPLSFPQERLWFLEQLAPGSAVFNIPVAVRLRGPLDGAALERALGDVAARHETLRTRFVEQAGRAVQEVVPLGSVALVRVDLQALPAERREAEAVRRANQEARMPFELASAPLWRASLLQLAARDHMLVLVLHHAIAEGAGIAILFAELAAAYAARRAGRRPDLGALPIQYADYAAWQRQRVAAGALTHDLAYWKGQLAGPVPALQLPLDHARPAVQTTAGAWRWTEIPAALTEQLVQMAQRENATLYMLLMAAFEVLLFRYTRQTDFAVGAAITQRDRPELEPVIGFFVNNIVLRANLTGDPTFRELLARVRATALDGYAHAAVPFEVLVETLQPNRDPSQNPLFQVFFEMPTDPMPVLALEGLEPARILGPLELNTGTARNDFSLYMWREASGMVAAIEFNTALLEAPTIERMLANFATLLEACAAAPQRRIGELAVLAPAEARRVLVEWNATEAPLPLARCTHELVEERARLTPGALAVAAAERRLSYAEWNHRANQLAHWLRGRGVGPDQLVAVLMERTPEMVTALLGVWKAGGAYVPLDPINPEQRQALMLADAGVRVILTDAAARGRLPDTEAEVLCLDAEWSELSAQRDDDPPPIAAVESLAYVIFTSGSTGRPKGVQITHRALLNLIHWHLDAYRVTAEDRATQLAGLAFDASVWELWPYLVAGASIHLPADDVRAVPAALIRWLAEQRITLSFAPTPLCEAMLKEPWPDAMPLRALLTGGDKLHHPPPHGLPFALVNHYGPTENAVVSTCARVAAGSAAEPQPPIGRPIANTAAYVLDDRLQPVPIGVAGELCVGGRSLARGYHGRPAATAASFVPSPFAPGERLYRTGDLVRHRSDGMLEFLGRIDDQVKVRGFRIELGEIEAALDRHPSVRDSVVLARPGADGARLVAWVVPHAAVPPPAELRAHLKQKLPDYMVPATWVFVDAFPLTANGKIDRKALPEPTDAPLDTAGFVAPENEVQQSVAALWRELLKLERVGIHDNFFDLGGHSLLIVQLHRRLQAAFDQKLTVAEMFQYPTVAAMAQRLAGKAHETPAAAIADRTEQRRAGASRTRRLRERRQRE